MAPDINWYDATEVELHHGWICPKEWINSDKDKQRKYPFELPDKCNLREQKMSYLLSFSIRKIVRIRFYPLWLKKSNTIVSLNPIKQKKLEELHVLNFQRFMKGSRSMKELAQSKASYTAILQFSHKNFAWGEAWYSLNSLFKHYRDIEAFW